MKDGAIRNVLRRTCLNSTFWDYRVSYKLTNGQNILQRVQIRTVFLLGKDPKKGTKMAEIETENAVYGDILMGKSHDSFQNLAIKEHMFLDYIHVNSENADFIYKGIL